MKNPPDPDSELHMQAMMLYQSIQIAALEEMVAKIGDVVIQFGPDSKSKSALEALYRHREVNIRNILRHRADIDPSRASRLVEMLLKMNKGEQP